MVVEKVENFRKFKRISRFRHHSNGQTSAQAEICHFLTKFIWDLDRGLPQWPSAILPLKLTSASLPSSLYGALADLRTSGHLPVCYQICMEIEQISATAAILPRRHQNCIGLGLVCYHTSPITVWGKPIMAEGFSIRN